MTSPQSKPSVLPHGSSTTLSGLSETFSFHSSPESFITSRVLAFQAANPVLAKSRTPIRARVLNRNVAVVSSYDHVKQLLCDEDNASKLSAGKAYDELMAPFFSPPNLLLADHPVHEPMKSSWRERMLSLPDTVRPMVEEITTLHFQTVLSGSLLDLYESMKRLSWSVILRIFLFMNSDLDHWPKEAVEIERLQEDLLRGQFSLFPVSVNTRFWRSPRAKGIAARTELQKILKGRVQQESKGCPFAVKESVDQADVANHMLLFTSSLAVKSLASLLTAVMLNLYIYSDSSSPSGPASIACKLVSPSFSGDRGGDELLRSIIVETERLSPPVVGIMRRTVEDITLQSQQDDTPDTLIPKGWDIWLYFVGASRDPARHPGTEDKFLPDRHYNPNNNSHTDVQPSFAFGAGPKTCLGEHLMRDIVTTVAKICLGSDSVSPTSRPSIEIQSNGQNIPKGVQAWLGWQQGMRAEDWAKDMKQLPTQRPAKPMVVKIVHNLSMKGPR